MTFAEELRHAASVDPAGVKGNKVARLIAPLAEVLDLDQGFDRLLAVCRAKAVFTRPFWTEMRPPEGGDEAQLRWYLALKCPVPAEAALWWAGSYFRLFYRTRPRQVWSQLSVGSGMTPANRLDAYRALWDVGIRELHHHLLPDNPHTATVRAMGHFQFEQQGRYLHGVKYMVERP
mgnify:FL=1